MNKEKKIINYISLVIVIILLFSTVLSFIFYMKNKKIKDSDIIYLCIYQYETIDFNFNLAKDPVLLEKYEFTKDLYLELSIKSIDCNYYNNIYVHDGKCYITDANCLNQICTKSIISLDNTIFNTTSISCMPSGLYICIESNNIIYD